MITKENYFNSTFGEWVPTQKPKREPDYVSYNKWGQVSSKYWYTSKGVYRESDHWSQITDHEGDLVYATEIIICKYIRSCFWAIRDFNPKKHWGETVLTAYIQWHDLIPDRIYDPDLDD